MLVKLTPKYTIAFIVQVQLISKTQTWFALPLPRHQSHQKWTFLTRMFQCARAALQTTPALLAESMYFRYSASYLIGSRIIESLSYCNQILRVPVWT